MAQIKWTKKAQRVIMRRFKLVHYYAKSSDTVYIVDIWDTKMCPENLKRRIK